MGKILKISALQILILVPGILIAQNYSVSGYITDKDSRETLIGATVQIEKENKAVVADKYGYFIITGLKSGNYTLSISHIGYTTKQIDINIEKKGYVLPETKLEQAPFSLDQVTIVSVKPDMVGDPSIETSHISLTPQMIQSIPTAGKDVFAAIKYLPGIERTEPYSPLYSVRGGDPGENGVLLDGVMIYNPYHASINSGIFNTQTIKNVDLLVGGYGAEFGGRNSSFMYISTKDGNVNELHGEIEPSSYFSKAFLEFPAGKNASMTIAGRYLYDIPYNFMFSNENYFYDINLSYTNRINDRNRLTFKYFESKDYMGYNFNTFFKYIGNTFDEIDFYDNFILKQRINWVNRASTIIHKLVVSPRLYIRTQAYYSFHNSSSSSSLDFKLEFSEENKDTIRMNWSSSNSLQSKIADAGIKSSVNLKISNFNSLQLGVEYNYYEFVNRINLNEVNNGDFHQYPDLIAAYAEDKFTSRYFSIRPGLRITNYQQTGWQYEPRINLNINLPGKIKFKAAYGNYLQYIISMNTAELEMNQIVDYYYPLKNLEPTKATHYIIGFEKRITNTLLLSLDSYYKDMPNVYAFDMNNLVGFSNKLKEGTGYAYGLELTIEGKYRNISGWASYTYSAAKRQYNNSLINNGEEYVFEYNRPHAIKAVGSVQLTTDFALNGSFVFLSGSKRSIETTMESYFYYNPASNETSYFPMWTTDKKNNARMPPIISLDLGIKRRLTSGFGKDLANFLRADESFVSISIRNILFLYRNIDMYIPTSGIPRFENKYLPFGSNYYPQVGFSYTLKF
ncbi:MAG: TonB-dependent receptor [Bacteroidales bacterium]|nr:TonB-dependent receptor [Bacteroidales bacterium]MBN2820733.1 TonB-dependent receptor [Bacteroidales bacterium]